MKVLLWARKESDLRPSSYQDDVIPLNYAPVSNPYKIILTEKIKNEKRVVPEETTHCMMILPRGRDEEKLGKSYKEDSGQRSRGKRLSARKALDKNTAEIRNPEAMLTRVEKTAAFFPDGTFLRLVRLCLVAYNLLRISQSPTRLRHLFKRLTVAPPNNLF